MTDPVPLPDFPTIRLAPGLGRRVERGHLWVFSNEVAAIDGAWEPGDEAIVLDARGRFAGMALLGKSALIRGRIYSRRRGERCAAEFLRRRIAEARAHRTCAAPLPHSYRLVHGEGDGLPGLVCDVFGDHIVLQILTAAMERRRDDIVAALRDLLAPHAIVERSDVAHRELEGLPPQKAILFGQPIHPCPIRENRVEILADLIEGQKTGYFLDQIANRTRALPLFPGRRVLDLFCYLGAWSLVAARAGAAETLGLDSSAAALELAARSRDRNRIDPAVCRFEQRDVFAALRAMEQTRERFDVVVLDPPALAKSRRDAPAALRAYRELNLRAMRLLTGEGVLITCSCSHAVGPVDFREMLTFAARDAHCDFSIIDEPSQSPDHPVHLQTPETAYLKAVFLRKRAL